jgi:hypothetical protein
MKKIRWVLVGVWAMCVQGCGAGAQSATPTTPVAATPSQKPITDVKAPAASEAVGSTGDSLCTGFDKDASTKWVRTWDNARSGDLALEQRFVTIGAAPATCSVEAGKLRDEIQTRENQAETLCDERARDAGESSRKFRAASKAKRDAMNQAFAAAEKDKTAGCVAKLWTAKAAFNAWLEEARNSCSPAADAPLVECERARAVACTTGSTEDDKKKAVDCRAAVRAATAPVAESRDPNERAPLTGAGLETAILTGAADFFVERAEQEMSLFAAEVLGRRLCAKGSLQRMLLPKTCELLDPDSEEPVVGASPVALRAAAKADLDRFPERVIEEISKQEKGKELACAAAFTWSTARQIAHGAALADLLKDPTPIVSSALVRTHCSAEIIDGLTALSAHIKLQLEGEPARVAAALRSADANRLLRLDASLIIDPELRRTVEEVLRRLVQLDQVIATYRKEPTPEARVDLVVAAMQVIVPIATRVAPGAEQDVLTSIDLVTQVLNKEYAQAVITASSLKVLEKALPPTVTNAVGLAAGLAQAESSDDVRQTLKDAALPLGSWRRKNERRFGATLTGMVGFNLGFENVLQRPAPDREVNSGWTVAPALMVGVDVHYGLSKSARVGLHLNVLDLGALGSIRLENPEVKNTAPNESAVPSSDVSAQATPEVRVEQVFAPGLFPYVGLGPFNAGPTLSYVPSLRPARLASGELEPLSVVRYGFVLAVDVSVLPLL